MVVVLVAAADVIDANVESMNAADYMNVEKEEEGEDHVHVHVHVRDRHAHDHDRGHVVVACNHPSVVAGTHHPSDHLAGFLVPRVERFVAVVVAGLEVQAVVVEFLVAPKQEEDVELEQELQSALWPPPHSCFPKLLGLLVEVACQVSSY